tara:strand:+ start:1058 stop:2143 length:1086 start_codon:yes stop_codon:yes gene_type:complete
MPTKRRFNINFSKNKFSNCGEKYIYIDNFEDIDENKCIQFDKHNDKIYVQNLRLYYETNKKLKNSQLKIDKKPIPPHKPTNFERFISYKEKKTNFNEYDQTYSILYLMLNNYKINFNNDNRYGINICDVIQIADMVSMKKKENIKDVVNYYLSKKKFNKNISEIEYIKNCRVSTNNKYKSDNNSLKKNDSGSSIEYLFPQNNKTDNNNFKKYDTESNNYQESQNYKRNKNIQKKINDNDEDSLPTYSDNCNNILFEYSNNISTFPQKKYSNKDYECDMLKFNKRKFSNNNINQINGPRNISQSKIFICNHPESHNVSDKINFYENNQTKIYPDLNDFHLNNESLVPSAPMPPSSPLYRTNF